MGIYLGPQYKVPIEKQVAQRLPAQIGPPYNYPPITDPLTYDRKPIRYSALIPVSNFSGSDTQTDTIDTVTVDGILVHYNIAASFFLGSISPADQLSFRIDIMRGGDTIFNTRVMIARQFDCAHAEGSPPIVLRKGDLIQLTVVRSNCAGVYYDCFVCVVIQPLA